MNLNFLFILGATGVLLMGAGCGSKSTTPTTPAAKDAAKGPYLPSRNPGMVAFQPEGSANASVNAELTKVIENFKKLKTFRVKMHIASPQGDVTSKFDFIRPSRFHGEIQTGTQPVAEVIVVDNDLFLRAQGQKWMNLSGTPNAEVVGASLKKSLLGDQSLDAVGIKPDAIVTKSYDDKKKCDNYRTNIATGSGGKAQIDICVRDGLPFFMTLQGTEGNTDFEYYDHNALFTIEKPI